MQPRGVVKLINTDGMAFIGPGSEWFWTALSGVVLAVTFLGIYRQLRIARSANAFEQRNRIVDEYVSERITRYQLDVLVALRDGTDPADLPYGAASFLAAFWADVALLVRAGHVDRRLVYQSVGNTCRWWWAALSPWTHRVRIEADDPRTGRDHEWLAGVIAEMDMKEGVSHPFDEAYLASTLDRRIQRARDDIRLAEELRAVIVRPMSPLTPPATSPATQGEAASAGPPA
jgi:hypothetical protein